VSRHSGVGQLRIADAGLQPERTALAWERTAIASMVSGMLLARYAAGDSAWIVAWAGVAQTLIGASFLIWTGRRYVGLHGPITAGADVSHPGATSLLGVATAAFAAVAFVFAAVEIGTR